MKVLGITGGVGAGKSTVLNYLKCQYGATVIQCDEVAGKLQEPGGLCYQQLLDLLTDKDQDMQSDNGSGKAAENRSPDGTGLIGADGCFNRKMLAAILFADQELLQRVNAIVHPAVRREVSGLVAAAEKEGAPFAVVEAALLLEEKYDQDICDEVWYIFADEDIRCRRLKKQRGYSEEKSRSIMAAQQSERVFRARCALCVDNSSENVQNTFDQIDKGLKEHGFV